MARKADQLHGPYSTWDMGDRPDKLVKEIEAARAKLKVAATKPPAPAMPASTGAVATAQPKPAAGAPANSGVQQVAGTADPKKPGVQPAAATDPKKAVAVKLMADGKALADQGNFVAAKGKFIEADRIGAAFAPGEYSPGFALQELNTRGAAAMDKLIRDSQAYTAQKDYAKADAALTGAAQVAAALGLFPKPVVEAKAALFVASAGKFGSAPPGGMMSAPGQEYLVGAGPNTSAVPALPPGTQTVYGGPKAPPAPAGTATGRQLLAQAEIEFKAGQFDTAERLAVQAHNLGGVQDEARGLLKQHRRGEAQAEAARRRDVGRQRQGRRRSEGLPAGPGRAGADRPDPVDRRRQERAGPTADDLQGRTGQGRHRDRGWSSPAGNRLRPAHRCRRATRHAGPSWFRAGVARVGPDSNPTATADALRKVQLQKLRSEGLKVQADAQAAFGRARARARARRCCHAAAAAAAAAAAESIPYTTKASGCRAIAAGMLAYTLDNMPLRYAYQPASCWFCRSPGPLPLLRSVAAAGRPLLRYA